MGRQVTQSPTGLLEHLPSLDGLRAIAILLVIPHNSVFKATDGTLIGDFLGHLQAAGWVGVQLFFAISGFLITRILLATRGRDDFFLAFYLRRAFRILPPYWLLLLLALALAALGALPAGSRFGVGEALALALFLPTLASASLAGLGHLWSLAVEEQFYVVWPLAVRCLSPPLLAALILVLLAAVPAYRGYLLAGGASLDTIYYSTTTRVDGLLYGALVAMVLHGEHTRPLALRWWPLAWWMTLVLVLLEIGPTHGFQTFVPVTQHYGYSALGAWFSVSVGACALGAKALPAVVRSALGWRPLQRIGAVSYVMYLAHDPLNFWLFRDRWPDWWRSLGGQEVSSVAAVLVYCTVLAVCSWLVAEISGRTVERWAKRARDRLEARPVTVDG